MDERPGESQPLENEGPAEPASETPSDATEPASEGAAAPAKGGRAKWAALIVGALVLVAGGGALALVFALRGSNDVVTPMVPKDAAVYAVAYLDPSLSQKLALRDLSKKFSSIRDQADLTRRIDQTMDSLLAQSGLRFSSDVRPWLGPQIGVVVEVKGGSTQVAVLIASKDASAAQAALRKVRDRTSADGTTWTDQTHGGVTLSVGSGGLGSSQVYAYVGDAAVLANGPAVVDDVVDTTQGAIAGIASTPGYQKVVAGLPTDRLALVYVNIPPLVKELESSLSASGLDVTTAGNAFAQLEADQGLGMTISAKPNGIAADMTVTVDPSKLTTTQRQALAVPAHANAVLGFTPDTTLGVLGVESLKQTLQTIVDQATKQDPAFAQTAQDYGLTGPDGIIGHLTGDAGWEVDTSSDTGLGPLLPVQFAVMAGTDDKARMESFLSTTVSKLTASIAGSGVGSGGVSGTWSQSDYRGATIHTFSDPALEPYGVTPSYAVSSDGMAILASSASEVQRMLDAHLDGKDVSGSVNYRTASQGGIAKPSSIFYLNVQGIATTIRQQLPPDQQQQYDANVDPNLRPIKSFLLTSVSSADRGSFRMFLFIQ